MIILKKLSFKNIMSVGNQFIDYTFENKILSPTGKNGSGKSIILNAICFVFYGKPYNKLNQNDLINKINKSNLEVHVDFSIGKNEYKIIRGLKPNILKLYINDELEKSTSVKDLQNKIESILNIDYNLFTQTVVIGRNYKSFFELSSPEKRNFLEELFNIEVFSEYHQFFKNKFKEFDYEYNSLKNKLLLYSEIIEKDKKELQIYIEKYEKNNENKENDLKDYENKLNELINYNTILEEQYKSIIFKKNELRVKVNDFNFLKDKLKNLKNEIKKLDNELEYFNSNKCPTCGSLLEKSKKNILQQEREKEKEHLIKEYKTQKNNLLNIAHTIKELKEKNSNVLDNEDEIKKEIRKNNEEQNYIRDKIFSIKNNQKYDEIILKLKQSISENEEKLNEIRKEIEEKEKELEIIKKINDILSNDELKYLYLKSYIKDINIIFNDYLRQFDFEFFVEIKDDYECYITYYNGNTYNYYNLSQGEQSRINLANIMTFRKVFSLKGKNQFNVIILDEVFDGALDNDGIDNLMNILYNIEEKVILISHKEIKDYDVVRKYFKKINGFTQEVVKE